MTEIKTVGVLGCGLMGSGIAQVCAAAGYRTIVREVSPDLIVRGRKGLQGSLEKAIERGKMKPEERDAILSRLAFTTDVADLAGADVVVEAVTEDLDVKNALWTELDALCGPDRKSVV